MTSAATIDSDPAHQGLAFRTKVLGCLMHHYTITRDGRLVRDAGHGRNDPRHDVEWPIHGDVRISRLDRERQEAVEYLVRFTRGRVEWVRSLPTEGGETGETAGVSRPSAPPPRTERLVPAVMGRGLAAEEFQSSVPEKLDLVGGRIPGDEKLLLALLVSLGLGRAVELVGADLWWEALSAAHR